MALKFLYITNDPFTNKSQEFVRILAFKNSPSVNAVTGTGNSNQGFLYDNLGNLVATFQTIQTGEMTEATAYPFAFSASFSYTPIILIPPGWTFQFFGVAIAIQGTLEEVLMVH